jgi:Tol biopolymer transport system component
MAWVDRSGATLTRVSDPGPFSGAELSPDGRRVATRRLRTDPSKQDQDGRQTADLWAVELRTGRAAPITFGEFEDYTLPVWSQEGHRIAFGARRGSGWGIYVRPADGTGVDEPWLEADRVVVPTSWSADPNILVYSIEHPRTRSDIWVLPLRGERKPVAMLETPANEGYGVVSPDGRWLAYQSDQSGRSEIYVRPFPGGDGQWRVSGQTPGAEGFGQNEGPRTPRWRKDGRELLYVDGTTNQSRLVSVPIEVQGSIVLPGRATALFEAGYRLDSSQLSGLVNNWLTRRPSYAVDNDGTRFLTLPPSRDDEEQPLTVVLNWTRRLSTP